MIASVSVSGLKALAPRAVAFRPRRDIRVNATDSGTISGTKTEAAAETAAPKAAATPAPRKTPVKTKAAAPTAAEQEMQSSIFFLMFWSFCTVMSGCYFQLQGFKI
eukprot:GFKZ01011938.1.p2 GENE.GFKZ01011938.1~~GFKZ01011938.1.p2  ORF type:complete len:106 (-),score=14.64 GFKZ01011938.1:162-479(-)